MSMGGSNTQPPLATPLSTLFGIGATSAVLSTTWTIEPSLADFSDVYFSGRQKGPSNSTIENMPVPIDRVANQIATASVEVARLAKPDKTDAK